MSHQLNTSTTQQATTQTWFETFNTITRTPMNGDSKAVLMAVLSYANGPGRDALGSARPGVKRLVENTGLGRSTVLRKLSELTEQGWLVVTSQGGGTAATTYAVAVPVELTRPGSGTPPVPEAGPPPSRKRDLTDSVPTHNLLNLSTTAAPRVEEMSAEGNGDRVPGEVLDAVQLLAGAPMNLDVIEAFEDVVAPVYGREVAEWITNSGVVHFEAGLSRYKAGARLRSALATARREGVGVLRMPAPRNVVDLHSEESLAIREQFEASLSSVKPSAPVSAPVVVEDAPVDPEPLPVAPSPLQASTVTDPAADPEDQVARMADYVARYEAAQAEREAAAAREARWADQA